MKQILQSLRTGETEIAEVPVPAPAHGQLQIRTSKSLLSSGTERTLVAFGKAGLLSKALQQPERVRDVLAKVRTDGFGPTIDVVRNKLDQPLALGYCNVGRVISTGRGVAGFAPGDRVASNGKHAEAVAIPANLCAPIPDSVSDEAAAFTVLGAIALQGIRLAAPTLGEAVVVTGLGLIGLLTVQILRANGCRVLGLDFDAGRLTLAERFGAETVNLTSGADPVSAAMAFSRGRGVDAVIITASSKSSEPVHQAAQMCRKRGRIVLVGVTGLDLSRADFYEKELSFQVSCSYGPGRHDPNYEEKGQDYPVGFVRWTEQRNFEAVLDLMTAGRIDTAPLVSHRFLLDEAAKAYDLLDSDEPSLGILIEYPAAETDWPQMRRIALAPPAPRSIGRGAVSFIGAGNYAGGVLFKHFKAGGADFHTLVSAHGVSARHYGRKFGFRHAGTDAMAAIHDPDIDTVAIATRHDSHAALVVAAIEAGKNVFVEKPLCLTLGELDRIAAAKAAAGEGKAAPILMVGFNRRFAPLVVKAKALIAAIAEPKAFTMTVNAGAIPREHWTQDPEIGGGRIVGEACHFIDLLRHLAGSPIADVTVTPLHMAGGPARTDTATLTLRFEDRSIGVINYLATGHRSYPKERLEIFAGGRILVLDNFRRLVAYGWPKGSGVKAWRQDKGQGACTAAFVTAIKEGRPSPIPFEEIVEVSRVAIEAAERAG